MFDSVLVPVLVFCLTHGRNSTYMMTDTLNGHRKEEIFGSVRFTTIWERQPSQDLPTPHEETQKLGRSPK